MLSRVLDWHRDELAPCRNWLDCFRLQAIEIGDDLARQRRGGEDRLLVAFQNFEPMSNILGVIWSRRVGDFKMCAIVGSSNFNDDFFEGIFLVPEPFAEFAVETMARA